MSKFFEFPEAEWVAIGAVGEPGHRTFFLQAEHAGERMTLKLEKQHVQALSQFLAEILADLPGPDAHPAAGGGYPQLREPLEIDWNVGGIRLSYDGDIDRVILVAEELVAEELGDADIGDGEIGNGDIGDADIGDGDWAGEGRADLPERQVPFDATATATLGLTRRQAATLVGSCQQLVSSGRPACGLCGQPIDPEGHSCPRTNGHRPH